MGEILGLVRFQELAACPALVILAKERWLA
jgi:hypothetical protein